MHEAYLELGFLHWVPRDQVDVAGKLVAVQQVRQLVRVLLGVVDLAEEGVLERHAAPGDLEEGRAVLHQSLQARQTRSEGP